MLATKEVFEQKIQEYIKLKTAQYFSFYPTNTNGLTF